MGHALPDPDYVLCPCNEIGIHEMQPIEMPSGSSERRCICCGWSLPPGKSSLWLAAVEVYLIMGE